MFLDPGTPSYFVTIYKLTPFVQSFIIMTTNIYPRIAEQLIIGPLLYDNSERMGNKKATNENKKLGTVIIFHKVIQRFAYLYHLLK